MASKKASTKKTGKKLSTKAAAPVKTKAKAKVNAPAASVKAPKKEARVIPSGPMKFEKVTTSRTKSQVIEAVSSTTGLSKKEVKGVFESLKELIGNDLKKGPGMFNLPGLLKVKVVNKPASKARKGISPFTGEQITFKAKPARSVVKIRPLKALKEMV